MLTAILILYVLWAAIMFLVCIQAFRDVPGSGSGIKDTIAKLIASAVISIIWPVIMLFALSILVYRIMADFFRSTWH